MIFQGYPRGAQVERIHPAVVTVLSVGSSKQVTNHQLQLKADTRLANRQLQNAGLERTGKHDCQLVIEMIERTWNLQLQTYSSQPDGP